MLPVCRQDPTGLLLPNQSHSNSTSAAFRPLHPRRRHPEERATATATGRAPRRCASSGAGSRRRTRAPRCRRASARAPEAAPAHAARANTAINHSPVHIKTLLFMTGSVWSLDEKIFLYILRRWRTSWKKINGFSDCNKGAYTRMEYSGSDFWNDMIFYQFCIGFSN